MAKPSGATQAKRQRERDRHERKEEKRAERAMRKEQKRLVKEGAAGSEEDPDLAGIIPGPQPQQSS